MKIDEGVFVRRLLSFFVIDFVITLFFSRIGPWADHSTRTHSLLRALVIAAVSAIVIAWTTSQTQGKRTLVELDQATAEQVDALIGQGQKVAAIKAIRDATGAGLVEAKNTVDAREHSTVV